MNNTMERNEFKAIKVTPNDHFKLKEMALYQKTTVKNLVSKMIKFYKENEKQG